MKQKPSTAPPPQTFKEWQEYLKQERERMWRQRHPAPNKPAQ